MYRPGTSLVLALGFVTRVPWLVEPVLAAAGVVLICLTARRQFGLHTGMLASVLMASSPFLHLRAGPFMSHVPGMFWPATLIYAVTRYVERRSLAWASVAAFALGFLFLTREMSALLYAATVGGYAAGTSAAPGGGCPPPARSWSAMPSRPGPASRCSPPATSCTTAR